MERWAARGTETDDRRRQYLARGRFTGGAWPPCWSCVAVVMAGPYNDFAKLYTQKDREQAALLLQRSWRARKFSQRIEGAIQKRLELERRTHELQARGTQLETITVHAWCGDGILVLFRQRKSRRRSLKGSMGRPRW